MRENGLTSFAMHSNDAEQGQGQGVAAISDELASAGRARSLDFEANKLDPDTVARRYLDQMIASPSVPTLTAAEPGEGGPEYRTVGTEAVPLTGTTVVKFAQYYYKIPVHGSLITIELDDDNSLLAVNSALGDPTGVDPAASISPARALEVIREDAGNGSSPLAEPPRLYYYFDNRAESPRWRLVYMAKNVSKRRTDDEESAADVMMANVPKLVDYVIDAHTGELLATLPRTQTMTWIPGVRTEYDAQGEPRVIGMQHDGTGNQQLHDTVRNVQTHDFNYQDVTERRGSLPGEFAANPPTPWSGAAISAHANAAEVAEFLTTVLRRDGLDNAGGPFVSSINCTFNPDPGGKEWRNAAWIGTQMIYGQREVNGELQSYALAKDVVAHEIIHGLTDHTARLVYERESGALNESYSDIFGVIISNIDQPDVAQWNWEMGEDLDVTGVPLRDLSDPTKRGQPAHMENFKRLHPNQVPSQFINDSGWVHHNSGIHNKAAHNLMTSKKADGNLGFTPPEVAALFYLALTQFLSPTSGFSDSRRGVELAAQTFFRHDPPDIRNEKLAAIAKAFDDVGISAGV